MEKYLPLNEETAVKIVEESYDIIREILEAKLSRGGYKSCNHEAVVSYLTELKPQDLYLRNPPTSVRGQANQILMVLKNQTRHLL